MFAILEWTNPATLGGLAPAAKLLASVFNAATTRTTGFATVDFTGVHDAPLMTITLMMIGGRR